MISEGDLERDQTIALAVARLIATARAGGDVEIVAIPEKDDRTNPAVELVTADAIGRIVIEHTTVEPFTGQIAESHRIRPYAEALMSRLDGTLPAGSRFEINLDVGAVDGVRPTEAVLDMIATWVREAAPILVDGRPGIGGAHMVRSGPPDVPIAATLTRWPLSAESTLPALAIGRWMPPDLEARRQERLVTALEAKLPKLDHAAADRAERVLVVESSDFSLSNVGGISAALHRAADAFVEFMPEWIVLWEQFTSNGSATVWFLRAGASWNEDPRPMTLAGVPLRA